jgi:hypothetical protein
LFSGFCTADFVVTVGLGPGGMEGCHNVVGAINFASWGVVGDMGGKMKFDLQNPVSLGTAFLFSGFCTADSVVTVGVGPDGMEGCQNVVGASTSLRGGR